MCETLHVHDLQTFFCGAKAPSMPELVVEPAETLSRHTQRSPGTNRWAGAKEKLPI
jgi:hypothetical protein